MSEDEDVLMSDMNLAEDLRTSEPPFDTFTSSPTEDNRSPKLESRMYGNDVVMKGVDAEKGFPPSPPKKAMNPDTIHWLETSPDIKTGKKATKQVYSSDPQKLETMRDFDNLDEKKPLKA